MSTTPSATAFSQRIFASLESTPFSLRLFFTSFLALIILRVTLDLGVTGFQPLSTFQLFIQFVHTFSFFLFSFLLLLFLLLWGTKEPLEKVSRVLLFGFLVILLPPVIDAIVFRGELSWSFYLFASLAEMPHRFFTFFGENPHIGITTGVRVEVALVLLAIFWYTNAKTKLLSRALLVTFLAYVLLFFLGTLPSWLAFIFSPAPLLAVDHLKIAELFLSPEDVFGRSVTDLRSALGYKVSLFLVPSLPLLGGGLLFATHKKQFFSLLRNLRLPQIFYHNGLLSLGLLLAVVYTDGHFPFSLFSILALIVLFSVITSAWLISVIQNDIIDTPIDTLTNTHRPLITQVIEKETYVLYGWLLFGYMLFAGYLVSSTVPVFLLAYLGLATLYSLPPLRLKRFVGIATFVAALAGFIILSLGYILLSPTHTLHGLPFSLMTFLILAYTFLLPLKDLKDTEGDRKDHVYTLPVLLGERRTTLFLAGSALLFFLGSIFVMHTPQLFLVALFFGSLAFWAIESSEKEKGWRSFRTLPATLLMITFCYGLLVAFFLS
jgi:4-hydroxybenzoate polyprenyltransferase